MKLLLRVALLATFLSTSVASGIETAYAHLGLMPVGATGQVLATEPTPALPLSQELVTGGVQQASCVCGSGLEDCRSCQPAWRARFAVGATQVSFVNSAFAVGQEETGVSLSASLARESSNGLGIRLGAWLVGAETNALLATTRDPFELDVTAVTLDLDTYKHLRIEELDLLVGVGVRGAGLNFGLPDTSDDRYTAAGTSAFFEGRHPLGRTGCWEWGVTGGGRVSLLLAEYDFDNSPAYDRVDGATVIGQASIGIEGRRRRSGAADLLFGVVSESQVWTSSAMGDIGFNTTSLLLGLDW